MLRENIYLLNSMNKEKSNRTQLSNIFARGLFSSCHLDFIFTTSSSGIVKRYTKASKFSAMMIFMKEWTISKKKDQIVSKDFWSFF